MVAAMFAAQGYIVVAPNYAGYDKSTLSYHPLPQRRPAGQGHGRRADRRAQDLLAASAPNDAGALFITGYSQGGYVQWRRTASCRPPARR